MTRSRAQVIPLLMSLALVSCASTTPPPAPPAPQPIVYMPPNPNPPPPDEWNPLPDPTTGQVDVYHKGGYVGSVTGNEPADQDPPIPHPVATPATSSLPD